VGLTTSCRRRGQRQRDRRAEDPRDGGHRVLEPVRRGATGALGCVTDGSCMVIRTLVVGASGAGTYLTGGASRRQRPATGSRRWKARSSGRPHPDKSNDSGRFNDIVVRFLASVGRTGYRQKRIPGWLRIEAWTARNDPPPRSSSSARWSSLDRRRTIVMASVVMKKPTKVARVTSIRSGRAGRRERRTGPGRSTSFPAPRRDRVSTAALEAVRGNHSGRSSDSDFALPRAPTAAGDIATRRPAARPADPRRRRQRGAPVGRPHHARAHRVVRAAPSQAARPAASAGELQDRAKPPASWAPRRRAPRPV
jgi:hypothetical protein